MQWTTPVPSSLGEIQVGRAFADFGCWEKAALGSGFRCGAETSVFVLQDLEDGYLRCNASDAFCMAPNF